LAQAILAQACWLESLLARFSAPVMHTSTNLWNALILVALASALHLDPEQAKTDVQRRKLIINSHVMYADVLDVLLNSLKEVDFQNFNDVVVFVGGSNADSEPYIGKDDITFVNMTLNSFDLHGFSGLYKHRLHPRVEADAYMYIHDSVTVGKCFPEVFKNLELSTFELITPNVGGDKKDEAFSNICAFGKGVVENYGHNFDIPLTKGEGWHVENGESARGVKSILQFGQQHRVTRRIILGKEDMYKTGHPRVKVWYTEFDIYKYIFWNQQGDILENVRPMFQLLVNPVSCGGHDAPSCDKCAESLGLGVMDLNAQKRNCNGHCHWSGAACQPGHSPFLFAPSCVRQ